MRPLIGNRTNAEKREELASYRGLLPRCYHQQGDRTEIRAPPARQRCDAYRRWLSEVRLTSHRAHWTAEIVLKLAAGITALLKSVDFGKEC